MMRARTAGTGVRCTSLGCSINLHEENVSSLVSVLRQTDTGWSQSFGCRKVMEKVEKGKTAGENKTEVKEEKR